MQAWNLYFRQSRVYAKIDTHSAALLPEEIIVRRENVSSAALYSALLN